MNLRKSSFPPMVDSRTQVLILGSLPGEMALAKAQYYGNPRNHFWRLIGAVIERDLVSLGYEDRLQTLLQARVGLWDTVESAVRTGSLDAAIKELKPNALLELVGRLPSLRAVGLNGGTAARIGHKVLAGIRQELVTLPSSSPAHTMPFEQKLAEWMKLRPFLAG